jgi:hypothetical protein
MALSRTRRRSWTICDAFVWIRIRAKVVPNAGTAMPARMIVTATTMISSIRENPRTRVLPATLLIDR